MTTTFDRELYGFRFAETRRGDSLQVIAARELGDAARWTELISYNNLVPPFITDDPTLAGDGVLLTGEHLLVPAPSPVVTTTTDPDKVFETDIKLGAGGEIMTANGDFAVVSGTANLVQAIKNRVDTEAGDLIFHPDYGSKVRRLIGAVNGPTASLLAAQYAKSAVQADSRINKVTKATAEVSGDVVSVTIEAEAISGRTIEVTATP
jgi:phage baseplate assembly protein W